MGRRNWAVVWIVTLAFVVGACGTSGKKATTTTAKSTTTTQATTTTTAESTTSSSPTTEPDTGAPTTTKPPSAADAARAKAANIVAADLPAGWTSQPHSGGASTTFATCAPEIHLETETVAEAGSPVFTRKVGASQTQANSLTRIMSSEAVARAVIAKIADPAFVACTDSLIKKQGLKAGTSKGKLSPVAVDSMGDEAAGIDGTVSGVDAESGKQAQLGVSIIAIRMGDLVTVLTGAALGSTQSSDAALFQKLAKAVADRQHA